MAKTSQYQSQLTMTALQDLKNNAIKKAPRKEIFKSQRPKDDSKQVANNTHKSFLKKLREARDEESSGKLETELAKYTSNENKENNINSTPTSAFTVENE